jgi:hypothetical protein
VVVTPNFDLKWTTTKSPAVMGGAIVDERLLLVSRPDLVIGVREVHSAQQLGKQATLNACLGDERGDHRLAHAAPYGQRGLRGCFVQFGNLIGRFARLEQQFEPVWLVF